MGKNPSKALPIQGQNLFIYLVFSVIILYIALFCFFHSFILDRFLWHTRITKRNYLILYLYITPSMMVSNFHMLNKVANDNML